MFKKLFESAREALRSLKERKRSKEVQKKFEADGRPVMKTRQVMMRLRERKLPHKKDRPRLKPTKEEKAAAMYPPGTLVEMPSGATYKVAAAGNWLRVYLKPGERKEVIKWQQSLAGTVSEAKPKTLEQPSSSSPA